MGEPRAADTTPAGPAQPAASDVREPVIVNVRWWDGYLETFEASEVRFGSDLLWMRLSDGANRHLPMRHVRWFSTSKESHELRPAGEARRVG